MLHSVFVIIFVLQTLSWCQISGKISLRFYSDPNSQIHSISRGLSRGLQVFRLLLRPLATVTVYWRRKKRVYFAVDLIRDLKRQFKSKSIMTNTRYKSFRAHRASNPEVRKFRTLLKATQKAVFVYFIKSYGEQRQDLGRDCCYF